MEQDKKESDHEKEDLRIQIHELEQTLEEEKQAYEHNRQSLMNEAKIKDNLAEIRIAGLEEDWQEKLKGLEKALAEEKEALDELRKNQVVKTDQNHVKKLERVEGENLELEKLVTSLRKDLESVNQRLNEEKASYEEKLSELQLEMNESERARDEIKALQQQTRLMVNRAQEDWVMKHEELAKMKDDQAKVKVAISGLLSRYMGEGAHITEQSDLEPIIRMFQHNLDQFTAQANLNQENYENLEQEAASVSQKYDELLETHEEWRPIAIGMAEKLEEFRKMALYELINQFQISADEDELNILSKKVTPSEDDAAMWNEILQLASSIDLKSITQRLYKRTRDVVEQSRRYKKDYRELRGNNLAIYAC
ncbi:hypothetical protein BY458DRAFT_447431 [Sporodiniella umbellata]|nr:hypothetical protein BY458DRAFT_447431 [Sporodiniella umbellata]